MCLHGLCNAKVVLLFVFLAERQCVVGSGHLGFATIEFQKFLFQLFTSLFELSLLLSMVLLQLIEFGMQLDYSKLKRTTKKKIRLNENID